MNWKFTVAVTAWTLMLGVPVMVFGFLGDIALSLFWFLLCVSVFIKSADSWVDWIYFSEEE